MPTSWPILRAPVSLGPEESHKREGRVRGAETEAILAKSNPTEVLLVFLKLGLTSFGGPVAHLGYFREEFVARRKWLDEASYADLVAPCQFLPGPASSQVGIAVGLSRAGYLRIDLKAARTSCENSFGSSQAAKCPPRSTSLK